MVNKNRYQSGFAAVEILIAAFILMIVFPAVVLLILGSQKVVVDTELAHEGQLLAQKYLEEARNASLINFNEDRDFTDTFTSEGSDYDYDIAITDNMASCYKTITVDVSWQIDDRPQNITLTTQVGNPKEAIAMGGSCATSGFDGDSPWQQCDSDIDQDIQPAGSQARDIDVFSLNGTDYLAIAAEHSDTTSHDLWLYRVTNSGFTFISSRDLTGKEGISALSAAQTSSGNYLFVAKNKVPPNHTDPKQLRVISLADINNPTEVGSVLFTGNNEAKDVLYYDGFVYLAVGNSVHKINISNPAVPFIAATANLSAAINKLKANGNFLFAATADNNAELKVVNTTSMTTVGSGFNAAGNEDGTSLFILGNTVYLGRERSNSNPDFYVVDVTTPGAPVSLGSENLGHTANSYIIDIVVIENLAFVGSTKEEFEVWNVKDPQDIFKQCSPTHTVAQEAAGLDLLDNVVYGAIRSNDAIRRYVDTNNPPN